MHDDINKIEQIPKAERDKKIIADLLLSVQKEEKDENKKKIVISFLFLDVENALFNLGNANEKWFFSLIKEIRGLTKLKKSEVYGKYRNRYDPHNYIDKKEEKLNIRHPLLIDEQKETCQLKLHESFGRIHGFFIENVYYVVYLDPEHNMYDTDGRGKARITSEIKTDYEILIENYEKLERENNLLKIQNEGIQNYILDNCIECNNKDNASQILDIF